MTHRYSNIKQLLHEIRGHPLSRQERIEKAIILAEALLLATFHERTLSEKKKERWIGKMMEDPTGRLFLTEMADFSFRSDDPKRVINQLHELIDRLGLPKSLPEIDRFKLLLFSFCGTLFPSFSLKQVHKQILNSLKGILLWGSTKEQIAFFGRCRAHKIRVNLNHIGEAILGEQEAESRVSRYLLDLEQDRVDYISVKVSTLYSQIQLSAWDQTLDRLKSQLRRLYRAAKPHQFINLDMEEFRDLDLTVTLFKEVLNEPEFKKMHAGIALQAYLPDSFQILQDLADWAEKRDGAPVKVRLVKGANWQMEELEASIKNWHMAPFSHKWESDANYKKMLEFALVPERAKRIHIGVATHNLFDIAYALVLRAEKKLEKHVDFEMLSGMADPLQRIITDLVGGLTLYCPQADSRHFQHAVSYLIRRFDENGSPQNFLRHFFQLEPGNFFWEQETKRFRHAVEHIETLNNESRRAMAAEGEHEPAIDFSLEKNRARLKTIYTPPKIKEPIPLVIGGKEHTGLVKEGRDPSTSLPFYHYHCADVKLVDIAFETAKGGIPHGVFKEVARLMRERRDHLLTILMADGGKTLAEGDPELSEMIDFVTYYDTYWERKGKPRGTILVAPPWNFPAAIPTGGIVAALVTGNSVLFKPASSTVLIGWEIAKLFWEGGVPKTALQFLPCADQETKDYLLNHPKLAGVILTGSTETAEQMLKQRPSLHLMAETGGKNSIIVTAFSDRDLAVRDLISSAFGHSGQKCSACSLGILEREVYQSREFLNQLRDAAKSLVIGSCWDPSTRMGPLIAPPESKLMRALTTLDPGESWLVGPKKISDHLWTPGIKLGVKRGSFFHQTECFGPVLGLMEAKDLSHAIELANDTPFGLTSGLHSLDPREQAVWKQKIVAGNLYINRNITGAIVGRQPFGGCKASSFGPGKKAGGPLYCDQLVHLEDEEPTERGVLPQAIVPLMKHLIGLPPEEQQLWKKSVESYAYWAKKYQTPVDLTTLIGQKNLYYLVPKERIVIRYEGGAIIDLLRAIAAAIICQTPYTVSSVKPIDLESIVEEKVTGKEVRYLSTIFSSGKHEIPHYLREISVSFDYHRYGYTPSI